MVEELSAQITYLEKNQTNNDKTESELINKIQNQLQTKLDEATSAIKTADAEKRKLKEKLEKAQSMSESA